MSVAASIHSPGIPIIVGSNALFAVVGELVNPLAVLSFHAYTLASDYVSVPSSFYAPVFSVLLFSAFPVLL